MNEEIEAEHTNSKPKGKLNPLFVYILNRDRAALITSIFSVVIALGSIFIVVYKEFLESYDVSVNFDQIMILRLPVSNKAKIINEIIINEIISGKKDYLDEKYYREDPEILRKYPAIVDAAERKDKARLSELFSNIKGFTYKPSDELIRKYIGVQIFSPSFCIPMTIANSGSRFAHISHLYLIIWNKNEEKERWFFPCVYELKLESLIQRKKKSDADRIKQVFTGISIGPKEKIVATPAFVPQWEIDGKEIASNSMTEGTYEFQIFGYGRDSNKIFETRIKKFDLIESELLGMFKGADTTKLFEQKDLEKKLIGFEE